MEPIDPEDMMTSSNWNIFRVTDPLCGEFNGHKSSIINYHPNTIQIKSHDMCTLFYGCFIISIKDMFI